MSPADTAAITSAAVNTGITAAVVFTLALVLIIAWFSFTGEDDPGHGL